MSNFRWLWALVLAVTIAPGSLLAQQAATISGVVTDARGITGGGIAAASVRIPSIGVGTTTNEQGRYTLTIPGARIRPGQQVQITATRVGYQAQTQTVTLTAGATVTQNFTLATDALQLQELVVTGAGTTGTVERIATARTRIDSTVIQRSNETNVVAALAGRASNVQTMQASGEAGAATRIQIRGQTSLTGTGQPLFVVDGVPINNATRSTGGVLQGVVSPNRASDINPDDIESIEILKGPAATSIYGASAGAGGAVLITTKRGRPGRTSYSLRSTLQVDRAANLVPTQRRYGMGSFNQTPACREGGQAGCFVSAGFFSWGPELAPGTPTFDQVGMLYDTGRILDNTITVSGGSERTTFYLSGGMVDHNGYITGDNDTYKRYTVRLNASHQPFESITLGGNVAYVQTQGAAIQRGNSVNGLLLGALRSPAEFDNRNYLDANGLHRSYRYPNPTLANVRANRGFDNPFYAINESLSTTEVGRVYGNTFLNWNPLGWLRVNYNLGIDYANDDRVEAQPEQSSGAASGGQVANWKFYDRIIDHNLTATADYTLSSALTGSVTVGQNLNETYFRQLFVVGNNLLAPQPFKLTNTVTRGLPDDSESRRRLEGYFAQATLDVADQLFLTARLRNDGSSAFGTENQRAWYPGAQVAWSFTRTLGVPDNMLTFGKLRAAYGESGQQPSVFLLQDVFTNALLTDFNPGSQLRPALGGFGGLYSSATRGNAGIRPERVGEAEFGLDLGFLGGRSDLSVTHYRVNATDVIFSIPLAPSTGFGAQTLNAAQIQNRGYEAQLNVRPFNARGPVTLDLGLNYGRNRNKLVSLGDSARTQFFYASSFGGRTLEAVVGGPLGVFRGRDFARCGQDMRAFVVEACAGAPDGALYIGANGFPVQDPDERTIGDSNADWTGGLSGEVGFRGIRLSATLDTRQGGSNQNMTRASMYGYGTHADTEQRAACTSATVCTGNERVFGQTIINGPVVGPGAGRAVPIGENWFNGLGGIGGPAAQFQEDATFTRLREVGIAYSFSQPWVQRTLGFTNIEARVSGRNLITWTNYTGFDPEVSTGGASSAGSGVDWFVNPTSRAFVFTIGINR